MATAACAGAAVTSCLAALAASLAAAPMALLAAAAACLAVAACCWRPLPLPDCDRVWAMQFLDLGSVGEPQTMKNHPWSRRSSSGSMGAWAAELVAWSKFRPHGPAFCWYCRVGPVFSDPHQPEVNLLCSQVLLLSARLWIPGGLFDKGGILIPMIAVPSSCHSRNLNNNGLCPHFAARIPDSAHWFTGTL